MGVENYRANNKPGPGSLVIVATYAMKLDSQFWNWPKTT